MMAGLFVRAFFRFPVFYGRLPCLMPKVDWFYCSRFYLFSF